MHGLMVNVCLMSDGVTKILQDIHVMYQSINHVIFIPVLVLISSHFMLNSVDFDHINARF